MFNANSLQITKEILALIAELDEFKGAWRAIGRLAPDRLLALKKVATIESIGSSTRIEGSKLSDKEVERLLRNIGIRSFKSRDEQEVAGYAEVMDMIFAHSDEIELTENYVRQLHRDLLKYSEKDSWHRGEYKKSPNHVEAFNSKGKSLGVIFKTASPFDTPRLMGELISWTKKSIAEKTFHPLLIIGIFTVVFLEIHPFQDGNGRLSRTLTALLLLKVGYQYVPYSSLESIVEQSKDAYYLALRKTQSTIRRKNPDWQPWISFFLQALQKQKKHLEKKIEKEKIVLGKMPDLSIQILEIAREHGRVSMGIIVDMTGANRNTVKKHLQALVEKEHLEKHGAGRSTWYVLA